jgi:hypothetical protein
MKKPIKLKEIYEYGQRVRRIRERLNNLDNSYQNQTIVGASSSASNINMEPRTGKTKALFEMFGLNR